MEISINCIKTCILVQLGRNYPFISLLLFFLTSDFLKVQMCSPVNPQWLISKLKESIQTIVYWTSRLDRSVNLSKSLPAYCSHLFHQNISDWHLMFSTSLFPPLSSLPRLLGSSHLPVFLFPSVFLSSSYHGWWLWWRA